MRGTNVDKEVISRYLLQNPYLCRLRSRLSGIYKQMNLLKSAKKKKYRAMEQYHIFLLEKYIFPAPNFTTPALLKNHYVKMLCME
jgi:hypothetical protein